MNLLLVRVHGRPVGDGANGPITTKLQRAYDGAVRGHLPGCARRVDPVCGRIAGGVGGAAHVNARHTTQLAQRRPIR